MYVRGDDANQRGGVSSYVRGESGRRGIIVQKTWSRERCLYCMYVYIYMCVRISVQGGKEMTFFYITTAT